ESGVTLDDYRVEIRSVYASFFCRVHLVGDGLIVVDQSHPVDLDPVEFGGGLRQVDTEIVAMQVIGTANLSGSGCLSFGDHALTILEDQDTDKESRGKITDTNTDPAMDLPADSFFNLYFVVDGKSVFGSTTEGTGIYGGPVRLENRIRSIPPYHTPDDPSLNPTCYTLDSLVEVVEACLLAPPPLAPQPSTPSPTTPASSVKAVVVADWA
ncbi:hypothetical protein LCGC14_1105880, partial [marine sediment metagenome]